MVRRSFSSFFLLGISYQSFHVEQERPRLTRWNIAGLSEKCLPLGIRFVALREEAFWDIISQPYRNHRVTILLGSGSSVRVLVKEDGESRLGF